ncbi:glycosyltransferase [Shewanella gaetbuli]|uniref:Glycosyltransferase n=1 Tax=Shewanella gaetbuli TaxID=220752 RepID=A0A9X1ZU74_9GAMM|nr:glycosyltransferase [Shewanella gaetbuli]MCL1142326.1 glycosyltransferase [Shewanella gaetbuli]
MELGSDYKKIDSEKNKESKYPLESESVYQCNVNVVDKGFQGGERVILRGLDIYDNVLFTRELSSLGPLSTVFFTSNYNGTMKTVLKVDGKIEELENYIDSIEIVKVGSTKKEIEIIQNDRTIFAALATYPARKKLMIESVNSLIEQVDYIFIYLNEYLEIPYEIKNHKDSKKIICIVDPEGSRRAEGKFHWVRKVTGYYLTCDDDIVYPDNYIEITIAEIEKYSRKCIVGYHGIIFKDSVASFKSDRKKFYKFTDELITAQQCHLLGTGVSGFHASLLKNIDIRILEDYPFAVDPALSVVCKKNKIPMVCIPHDSGWLKSSEFMLYGLNEEKQNFKDKKRAVDTLLFKNNPWGGSGIAHIVRYLKKNKKIRKLINEPRKFVYDSRIARKFKR